MYIIQSLIGGFVILWGVGGWLKWYFYIQRRDRAKEWKCQPDRFLSPEDDRLEFWLGSMNMAIGSVLSGNGLFIHVWSKMYIAVIIFRSNWFGFIRKHFCKKIKYIIILMPLPYLHVKPSRIEPLTRSMRFSRRTAGCF